MYLQPSRLIKPLTYTDRLSNGDIELINRGWIRVWVVLTIVWLVGSGSVLLMVTDWKFYDRLAKQHEVSSLGYKEDELINWLQLYQLNGSTVSLPYVTDISDQFSVATYAEVVGVQHEGSKLLNIETQGYFTIIEREQEGYVIDEQLKAYPSQSHQGEYDKKHKYDPLLLEINYGLDYEIPNNLAVATEDKLKINISEEWQVYNDKDRRMIFLMLIILFLPPISLFVIVWLSAFAYRWIKDGFKTDIGSES